MERSTWLGHASEKTVGASLGGRLWKVASELFN